MRIMTIYGTRPEAIKVVPIIKAINADPELDGIAVSTGQHREMLDQVNSMFDVVPDHDLNIMSQGQTLNEIVARVITGVDALLASETPDAAIVQGDTSTVMGAAVAAFNRKIPVIHLEAGLRSGDINSPFPEEANRKLTSQITALHLAPTSTSRQNLLNEGHKADDIVVTGNSVIDTLMMATKLDTEFSDPKLEAVKNLEAEGKRLLLVTTHRRENLGSSMQNIGNALAALAKKYEDLVIVLPIHKNPLVREAVLPPLEDLENVIVTEPLAYGEFTKILGLATVVLTDSGGVQEEAPSLGKPVLVMRENTERPEAVEAGTVKLIGTEYDRLVGEVSTLLDDKDAFAAMANAVNPYGDGGASERTIAAIKWKWQGGERPADFGTKTIKEGWRS